VLTHKPEIMVIIVNDLTVNNNQKSFISVGVTDSDVVHFIQSDIITYYNKASIKFIKYYNSFNK